MKHFEGEVVGLVTNDAGIEYLKIRYGEDGPRLQSGEDDLKRVSVLRYGLKLKNLSPGNKKLI